MSLDFSLAQYGVTVKKVLRNPPPALLYEMALRNEAGTAISSTGAMIAMSGEKTGRSPKDKRIVDEPGSRENVWWGDVNIKLDEHVFNVNHERAIDYLNTRDQLYVIDGYAGWDERFRQKIRVICSRAYHALFMRNMLIRPTNAELEVFGEPDYVIVNAGAFSANRYTSGMTSKTSVALNFAKKEFVILGTEYAGEMKKGVFTIMNYLMPLQGQLSMHCSANESQDGKVSIFFGLSGTGKTTLSADPNRRLIGDDEHVWTHDGVFNIEGGCYAKAIHLTEEAEPDIFRAVRFGSVPIEYINTAKIPCVGPQPTNVIMLTADAFGVLPPVAKLTPEQAMYHFISGYTAKVAGTEVGVKEPSPTFSACFGGPFLVWHPTKYAELLAQKLRDTGATTWLVNTGWTGGAYGVGKRMSLKHTRAIIDAIHDGSLANERTVEDPVFGFHVPSECKNVPTEIMTPRNTWADKAAFDATAKKLAKFFADNFKKYESQASDAIRAAGPRL